MFTTNDSFVWFRVFPKSLESMNSGCSTQTDRANRQIRLELSTRLGWFTATWGCGVNINDKYPWKKKAEHPAQLIVLIALPLKWESSEAGNYMGMAQNLQYSQLFWGEQNIQNGKREVDMFLPIAAIALISLISESDIIDWYDWGWHCGHYPFDPSENRPTARQAGATRASPASTAGGISSASGERYAYLNNHLKKRKLRTPKLRSLFCLNPS